MASKKQQPIHQYLSSSSVDGVGKKRNRRGSNSDISTLSSSSSAAAAAVTTTTTTTNNNDLEAKIASGKFLKIYTATVPVNHQATAVHVHPDGVHSEVGLLDIKQESHESNASNAEVPIKREYSCMDCDEEDSQDISIADNCGNEDDVVDFIKSSKPISVQSQLDEFMNCVISYHENLEANTEKTTEELSNFLGNLIPATLIYLCVGFLVPTALVWFAVQLNFENIAGFIKSGNRNRKKSGGKDIIRVKPPMKTFEDYKKEQQTPVTWLKKCQDEGTIKQEESDNDLLFYKRMYALTFLYRYITTYTEERVYPLFLLGLCFKNNGRFTAFWWSVMGIIQAILAELGYAVIPFVIDLSNYCQCKENGNYRNHCGIKTAKRNRGAKRCLTTMLEVCKKDNNGRYIDLAFFINFAGNPGKDAWNTVIRKGLGSVNFILASYVEFFFPSAWGKS